MGKVVRKYGFAGLDVKSNALARGEGTAQDCRNVLVDSSGNLTKIKNFNILNIPRGVLGEVGEFLDKLPHEDECEIIDIIPYSTYAIIAILVPITNGGSSNKFYKYFEESNTVEFIPFQMEVYNDPKYGQVINKADSDSRGKFSYTVQEDILYLMGKHSGSELDIHNQNPSPVNANRIERNPLYFSKNLAPLYAFDGKVITFAGIEDHIATTIKDEGLLTGESIYFRVLPIKIDDRGRCTFGNYSTHYSSNNIARIDVAPSGPPLDLRNNNYNYQNSCYFRSDINLTPSVTTVNVRMYDRSKTVSSVTPKYLSLGKGQYVYGVTQLFGIDLDNNRVVYNNLYRATVANITNIVASPDGATLWDADVEFTEYKRYDPDTGIWKDSDTFSADVAIPYLSNIMYAVYTSKNYSFGYKFSGMAMYGWQGEKFEVEVNTQPTGGTYSGFISTPYLLNLSEELEDIYDISTVKFPPPRGRQVNDYLGELAIVDHDNFYFSDISVGGSQEVFNPLDTFKVGASKRGDITSIFTNETFLAIFREEEAYYISGNIFLSNYKIQAYRSTRIGCISPTSAIDFMGSGFFLSKRGFAVAQQGAVLQEVSDQLELIFTKNKLNLNLDLSSCKAVVDYVNEYIYFHIQSSTNASGYVFMFNYKLGRWFLADSIEGNGGFEIINNSLYTSDGKSIYKEDAELRTSANGYYRGNFETLGTPSLLKKFLQVLIYSIDSTESHSIRVKTYRDWNIDTIDTDETKSVEGTDSDTTQRLNPNRSKSLAIEIYSDSGYDLKSNGFELEFMDDVGMFKNEN